MSPWRLYGSDMPLLTELGPAMRLDSINMALLTERVSRRVLEPSQLNGAVDGNNN